jgi:alpha-galactosidase
MTAVRQRKVTFAVASARLGRGQHGTVTLNLNAAARRLLASRHRLSVRIAVTGTVIGVLESSLGEQRLELGASRRASRASAPRAARRHQIGAAAAGRAASVLAPTPYMGWDTYFAFGSHYSEATVLRQASELISSGLARQGYRYVWLDVGWWQGARDRGGQIHVGHAQWPHGLAWLARTLHAAGLLVGLYTDAGLSGCGGAGQGSFGHYQQDVDTFAAWGFDAVKVDFCGGAEDQLSPSAAYGAFHAAIEANASHRRMLLSVCNFLQPGQYAEGQPTLGESAFSSYTFGPSVGSSWRTDTDVGAPGHVSFAEVLRNMDADAAQPQAAGPGHWNDPDYLGPGQGLSAAQFRTQLSMWAVLAAPLMISADLTRISAASRSAVANGEVLAVDQDPAGVQGTLVSSSAQGQVWVRPLADGSRAVALLNRGSGSLRIGTSAAAIGMPAAARYLVRDLWRHATRSSGAAIAADVGGQSTTLLRVYLAS